MLTLGAGALVIAAVVVTVGALLQGAVGFGLALFAAPLLALVDPALVPVPVLMVTAVHALLTLRRERGATDWRGVGWATTGRIPGIAVGAAAVTVLSPRAFTVVIALTVLLSALLSVLRWRPRPTVVNLLVAGVVSGAGGTASSIGGPPVALLYQDARGPEVRATLAAYFAAGTVLSLVGLAVAGQVDGSDALVAALLVPCVLLGLALSGPLRRVLDRGGVRPAVLTVSMLGALLLLVRATVG